MTSSDRSVEVVPWGPSLHDKLSEILEQHERRPSRTGVPLVVMPSDEGRRTLLSAVQQRMQGPIDASRVTTVRGLAQRCLLDLEIKDPLSPIIAEELVVGLSIVGHDDSVRWRMRDEHVLHQALLRESIPSGDLVDAVDLSIVRRSLRTIRQRTGRTTFEVQMNDLIERLKDGTTPFTLLHTSEVLLVHLPSITSSQMQHFLRAIHHHVPIHEIHAPGSLADGRAGIRLWSESDTNERAPFDRTRESGSTTHVRIGTEGSDGEIEAALSIIHGCVVDSDGSFPSVTIVDWGHTRRSEMWERHLLAAGCWEYQPEHKVGPSLRHLVETATSADAWSRTRMRRLSRDSTLNSVLSTLFQAADPSHPPEVMLDSNEISELGGVHHIVGGSGALGAWLDILDTPPRADLHPHRCRARQSTQLALHALAHLLGPWLMPSDRQRLSEQVVGCHDQETHLFRSPFKDPEESIDLLVQACPGRGLSSDYLDTMSSIRTLTGLEGALGLDAKQDAAAWADRFFRLLEDRPPPRPHRHHVQVLSPDQAAGSTCDLLILAGLSSEYSSTILSIPPLLDEEQALASGFKGPRATLGGHLQIMDLCFSSGATVIMLDPSADSVTPLSLAALNVMEGLTWEEPPVWLQSASGMDHVGDEWVHSRWEVYDCHLLPTSLAHPHRRACLGVMARQGSMIDSLHRPLNGRSVAFPFDGQMLKNNLASQPRLAEVDEIYLLPERHSSLWSLTGITLIPSSRTIVEHIPEHQPANLPAGVLLGGRSPNGYNNPSRDPRPLDPRSSGVSAHDARMGDGPPMELDRWSASGLRTWVECPRRAWMTRVLRVQSTDAQDDGVAGHRVGNLLHSAWAATIADTLGFLVHQERGEGGLPCLDPSHHDVNAVIRDFTLRLIHQEGWLRSGDTGAAALHRLLFGQDPWPMSHTPDEEPILPVIGGIVRDLVQSEFNLEPHRVLSLEHWFDTLDSDAPFIGSKRSVHGAIDRVELLRLPSGAWIDTDAPTTVIPLGSERTKATPRRCVMIRDLKFVQSSVDRSNPMNRWRRMIYEDVQLALYARAWEVTHPGDMVVGVGGTIIGAQVDHFVIKRRSHQKMDDPTESDYGLAMMHGLVSSSHTDPFDGWLQERLSMATAVVEAANKGRVPPTPGIICSHCPVIAACEVGHREDLP